MSTTTELTELKINYLTEAQYQAEVSGGTIDENALYMTPASGGGGGSVISVMSGNAETTVYDFDGVDHWRCQLDYADFDELIDNAYPILAVDVDPERSQFSALVYPTFYDPSDALYVPLCIGNTQGWTDGGTINIRIIYIPTTA